MQSALIFILCVALPHYFTLPWWVAVINSIILVAGYSLNNVRRILRRLFIVCMFTLSITLIASVLDWKNIDSLRAFLLSALCMKWFEARHHSNFHREMRIIFAVGVMTAGTFILAYSTFLSILYGVFIVVLGLITLTHQQKIPLRHSLFPLIGCIPITIIIFLFFPRITGNLWDLGFVFGAPIVIQSEEEKQHSTLGNRLGSDNIENQKNRDARVLIAKFNDEIPELDQLYWRGPVLWHFDGTYWDGRENWHKRSERLRHKLRQGNLKQHIPSDAPPLDYEMTLFPHSSIWLYALDIIGTTAPSSYITQDHQLINLNPVRTALNLELRTHLADTIGADITREEYRWATTLPDPAHNPLTRSLTQTWQSLPTDEKIEQTLEFLHRNIEFTRKAPPLQSTTPIDDILFHSKQGHAFHFATSFAVMMRQMHIPTRIVAGFHGGTPIALTNFLMVTSSNAHIWTEVWIDGTGWKRIDPSAPYIRHSTQSDLQSSLQGDSPAKDKQNADTKQENTRSKQADEAAESSENEKSLWDSFLSIPTWVIEYDAKEQEKQLTPSFLPLEKWQSLLTTLLAIVIGTLLLLTIWIYFAANFIQTIKHIFTPTPLEESMQRFYHYLEERGFELSNTIGPSDLLTIVTASDQLSPDEKRQATYILKKYISLKYKSNIKYSSDKSSLRSFSKEMSVLKK